jgi:hypothetical protein
MALQGEQVLAGPEDRIDALAAGRDVGTTARLADGDSGTVGFGFSALLSLGTADLAESIIEVSRPVANRHVQPLGSLAGW